MPTGLLGRRHSTGNAGVHQCPAPHVQLLQDNHVCWGHPQVAAAGHPQTVGGVLPLLGWTLQIQYVPVAFFLLTSGVDLKMKQQQLLNCLLESFLVNYC